VKELTKEQKTKRRVRAWAKGLREVARFAEQHPDLFEACMGERFSLFAHNKEEMVAMAREFGACKKCHDGSFYNLRRRFGPHTLELCILSERFCERVQTGTRTVEKPDPEAPTITVEEPVFEWVCPESVLAPQEA